MKKRKEITAENIKKVTKAAQSKAQQEAAEKAKKEKLQDAENDRWLKTTFLDEVIDNALTRIICKAEQCKSSTTYVVGYNNAGSTVAPLLVNALRQKGFKAVAKQESYPSYAGCADNGYVNAHDAGFRHWVEISW
jgi:hypothetical protein